ncbi:unnamed protein product [Scytosiphon promiscuus]
MGKALRAYTTPLRADPNTRLLFVLPQTSVHTPMRTWRGCRLAQGLLLIVLSASGGRLHGAAAFRPAFGQDWIRRTDRSSNRSIRSADGVGSGLVGWRGGTDERAGIEASRDRRTRLFESIRGNREKIDRAMSRLRDATRSGDDDLAERLKAFIMHLRKRDPQFATQDAMDEALEQVPASLDCCPAALKLKLVDINQNPFRHELLDSAVSGDSDGDSGGSGDISEDMSWGFDQTFFGEEGDGDDGDEPDDYNDI